MRTVKELSGQTRAKKTFCLGLQLALTAFASLFNQRNKDLRW